MVQRVPRRLRNVAILPALLFLCITIYLPLRSRQHRSWVIESTVHGRPIGKPPEPDFSLPPFPYTPHEETKNETNNAWLAAVICDAKDVERRMLIRSTWVRMFSHVRFDTRFVLSNPGPEWHDTIRYENRTFGDLILLDHLREDDVTANTIKTLEFYKWLLGSGQAYQFVTKLDTDLWLNVPAFWQRYLLPRLSHDGVATAKHTIIGEMYYSDSGHDVFAHGAMYTVTWDIVQLLVSLQREFDIVTGEDAAIAILMHQGENVANFVNFKGSEKFDYDDRDTRSLDSAWARNKTHPNAVAHALYGQDAIAVHQLKDKRLFLKVAACFDENGILPMPEATKKDRTPPWGLRWADFREKMGWGSPYKSSLDKIPDYMWKMDSGIWTCDGIWRLGNTPTGFQ